MYRHKFGPFAPGTLAFGAALILLGAAAPKLLVHPNRAWMALAERLSWVTTRIVLAIAFFAVLTPIGAVRRLSGADPLRRRSAPAGSFWFPYSARQRDPRHYDTSF
jgi:hypothetical protein